MDAKDLARRCADAMWRDDAAGRALGLEIRELRPGACVMAMKVVETMVNGHGMCHGGYIFALADSAFAYACNTYNQRTVAQHCTVTFLRPGKFGDVLSASAVERSRSGRSGIYDISVARADGVVIAEFRGHSRTIEGALLDTADLTRGA